MLQSFMTCLKYLDHACMHLLVLFKHDLASFYDMIFNAYVACYVSMITPFQMCLRGVQFVLKCWPSIMCMCVCIWSPHIIAFWPLFWALLELPKPCLRPPFHWLALPHVHVYACISLLPCHVASLACMPRLHCILHACLVP